MKILIVLFLSLLSLPSFAQTPAATPATVSVDSVTINRFEAIQMKSRYVSYDTNTNNFVYNTVINFSDQFDAANFDFPDLCVMKQFTTVMNVLIENPELVNRLQISTVQIDYFMGPAAAVSSHPMKVELYSDPVLLVETGVNTDIHFGDRRDYCILQSKQAVLQALQTIALNH
jgi:hypothetical protein